tara:strand:- start:13934 stop:14725 length:792 start_codon:yes stop_codon:yes gene_type:complete
MHPFEGLEVPQNSIGVHWFGQSSFGLKHPDGTIILVDPYFPKDRPLDRFVHAHPPIQESTMKVDSVLLTHNHGDHTCLETLRRISDAFPHVHFWGPIESIEALKEGGFDRGNLTICTVGKAVSVGSSKVYPVWAKPPSGIPQDKIEPPDVQHLGYVIEIGLVRVYISGDPVNTFANHETLLAPIRKLKPQIGFLTTHPSEGEFPFFEGSIQTAITLGLKTAVPAHYSCFLARDYNPQDWVSHFPKQGPQPLVIPYNQSILYSS